MIRHSADPLGKNKTTKETFESLFLSDSLFLFIYSLLFQNAGVTTLTGLIFNNIENHVKSRSHSLQKSKNLATWETSFQQITLACFPEVTKCISWFYFLLAK